MGSLIHWNFYALAGAFNGFIALIVGVHTLLRDRHSLVHRSFFSYAAFVSFWSISYAIWQMQTDKSSALYWMGWVMVFCSYIPFAFYWFAKTVIGQAETPGYLYFILPSIFACFSWNRLMVADVVPRMDIPFWPVPGLLTHVFAVLCNGLAIYSFFLMIKFWKAISGYQRRSLGWIIGMTLVAWVGGSTNWLLWYEIPVPPIPHFFVGVSFMLIAYGVLRIDLFDVDVLTSIVRETKLSVLGTMSASINHELKSPLYVVKTRSQMCLDEIDRLAPVTGTERIDTLVTNLEIVKRETLRMIDIVQRFSSFMNQDTKKPAAKLVMLRPIIEDTLWLLSNEIETKKIRVVIDVPSDYAVFFVKRDLEEILFILLKNACEAVADEGGVINLLGRYETLCFVISIIDNGPGVPEMIQKQLFNPFVTKNKPGGTGLGLYIVQKLTAQNGAKVSYLGQKLGFQIKQKSPKNMKI